MLLGALLVGALLLGALLVGALFVEVRLLEAGLLEAGLLEAGLLEARLLGCLLGLGSDDGALDLAAAAAELRDQARPAVLGAVPAHRLDRHVVDPVPAERRTLDRLRDEHVPGPGRRDEHDVAGLRDGPPVARVAGERERRVR